MTGLDVVLRPLGSIAGTLVLSSVLAVPLVWTAQAFTRVHHSLQAAVGVATMVLGTLLLVEAGGAL